ncbi:hypothetical protein IPA_05945 [Ignicoccus pacificus DSM 13166]|uniref:Molybdate ABC transporter substrate-binding protein n=1 Tax=Ignicoccus pacificus DSM 13166 TaxID=940294 RepID=A0A977PK66_9CREN|nr:hypothetical protein IPA_05945 [Ignicoccus pacificus DSM 13166]
MMRQQRTLIILTGVTVVLVLALGALSLSSSDEPTFYLGAAMKKAWQPIVQQFEKEYHVKVRAIYGSSGGLLSQMVMAKRGDIYSPATPPYMEKAIKEGVVDPSTVRVVACLAPAILYPKGKHYTLQDLLTKNVKIAMCNTENCAVGKFIKQMLEKEGLWDKIKKKVVVYTENFAKLVSLLYMGEVDAALGWNIAKYWYPNKIDATILKGPMPYKPCMTIAISKFSKHRDIAQKFIEFLNSTYAKYIIFQKYHYLRPGALG